MPRPLPPSRFRRVAKWVGLVVCVVVFVMLAVNTRVAFGYKCRDGQLGITKGAARVVWSSPNIGPVRPDDSGWFATIHDFTIDAASPSVDSVVDSVADGVFFVVVVYIPLWMPFTLAAIPTAILWHRDRRTVKPGYCVKCGYDLRASKKVCPECGASKTVCPECGTAITPEQR